jgi:hypothetical protein
VRTAAFDPQGHGTPTAKGCSNYWWTLSGIFYHLPSLFSSLADPDHLTLSWYHLRLDAIIHYQTFARNLRPPVD